jgi:phosphorylated CTD-interacting factor 1
MNHKIIEFNLNSPLNFKLKIIDQGVPKLEPLLELYKGKLFCYIVKSFINNCISKFGTKIFSIKKSCIRTITNLFSSWIFSLYINYDFSEDYLLPTNYNNTTTLKETLLDLCKFDNTITDVHNKIDNVLKDLVNTYKVQLKLLSNYENSDLFKNSKNKYQINKKIHKNNFYKFDINVQFDIKNKRLINILNNLLIPISIYDKLSNCYTGPENTINDHIWAILFRYQLLGSNNHQLAVLPTVMNKMSEDFNLNFECFASLINNTFNHFCSVYYDLEKYFGSVGSFFNIIPIKGTFGFNPPYQKDVINNGIQKLFVFLNETSEELTFIITIPIWDYDGQLIMNNKPNINYGDFGIINEIKESKYFRGLKMISKEKFTYIDHNFGLYKNKTIQDTYVIILSNKEINSSILDNYSFESPKI